MNVEQLLEVGVYSVADDSWVSHGRSGVVLASSDGYEVSADLVERGRRCVLCVSVDHGLERGTPPSDGAQSECGQVGSNVLAVRPYAGSCVGIAVESFLAPESGGTTRVDHSWVFDSFYVESDEGRLRVETEAFVFVLGEGRVLQLFPWRASQRVGSVPGHLRVWAGGSRVINYVEKAGIPVPLEQSGIAIEVCAANTLYLDTAHSLDERLQSADADSA